MTTVLEVVKKTTDFLSAKGVESARLNAELIVGHALGLGRMQLYLQFERPLAEADLEKIRLLVRRRSRREPLGYVLGEAEFSGVKLKLDRRALVPRPETELLIEIVTGLAVPPPSRALDLGTGSGAIALALARAWPAAEIVAVDASPEALALARENAAAAGCDGRVAFVESDWFAGLPPAAPFGVIVATPPYLSAEVLAQTEPEVREYEPSRALAAAESGLADLRAIIRQAPQFLTPDGFLALETGPEQHADLQKIATE